MKKNLLRNICCLSKNNICAFYQYQIFLSAFMKLVMNENAIKQGTQKNFKLVYHWVEKNSL